MMIIMQKVYDINEINLNIEFKQHVIIIHNSLGEWKS